MSSLQAPSPRRFCGVCFFELSAGVGNDETDVPDPSIPACEEPGTAVEILERSARRRCETCAKILEVLTLEKEFRYLLWDDGHLEQVFSFVVTEFPEFPISFRTSLEWEIYVPDDISSPDENHQGSKEALNLAVGILLLEEDQSEQNSVAVRLIEDPSASGKYACLSHRWGPKTPDVSLTKSKLDSFKKGIDTDSLYPMLVEAIHTTHSLGIKYLWIDCLSIVQDDLQDWHREAATMGSIYGNAFVTIMATWCANGNANLFSLKHTEKHEIGRLAGRPVFLRPTLDSHPAITKHDTEEPYSELSKTLLSRGWVYQERHMSNRIIHFTEEELFWECREASCCECRSGEVAWAERRRIKPRTILKFSFDSDRLLALSAITKSFGEPKGFTYVAGIWDKEIGDTFLWHIDSQHCERAFPRFAPTWSWAAVIPPDKALISWTQCQTVKSFHYEVKPVSSDYYGQLQIARMKVCGSVFYATMFYSEGWVEAVSESSVEPEIRKVLLSKVKTEDYQDVYGLKVDDQYDLFDADYSIGKATIERGYISSGIEVVGLIFGSQFKKSHPSDDDIKYSYGLVLSCVDKERNFYERIGTFGMDIDGSVNTTGSNGKWLPDKWISSVAKQSELILI